MLRKMLEKKVGKLTNEEWKQACNIAQLDIWANRLVYRQKTSHQYLATVLVTAVNNIRKYHPESISA